LVLRRALALDKLPPDSALGRSTWHAKQLWNAALELLPSRRQHWATVIRQQLRLIVACSDALAGKMKLKFGRGLPTGIMISPQDIYHFVSEGERLGFELESLAPAQLVAAFGTMRGQSTFPQLPVPQPPLGARTNLGFATPPDMKIVDLWPTRIASAWAH
jgi:hypothetical protein